MRKSLFGSIILLIAFAAPVAGDSVSMIPASDLREEARMAREKNLVLVLEFSSQYCGFCRRLEELFLVPMQRNADYDRKVIIRKVSLDMYETLVDFDGREKPTSEFASRYGFSLISSPLLFRNSSVGVSETSYREANSEVLNRRP